MTDNDYSPIGLFLQQDVQPHHHDQALTREQ